MSTHSQKAQPPLDGGGPLKAQMLADEAAHDGAVKHAARDKRSDAETSKTSDVSVEPLSPRRPEGSEQAGDHPQSAEPLLQTPLPAGQHTVTQDWDGKPGQRKLTEHRR